MTYFNGVSNAAALLFLKEKKANPKLTARELWLEIQRKKLRSWNEISDFAKKNGLSKDEEYELQRKAMQDTIDEEGIEHYE